MASPHGAGRGLNTTVEVAALGGRCRLALELVPPLLFFPGSSNARKCRGGTYDLNLVGMRITARMKEGEDGSKESSKVMSEEAA